MRKKRVVFNSKADDKSRKKQQVKAGDALCQFLQSVQPDGTGHIGIDAVYDALPLLQDHMDGEGLEQVPDMLDDLSKGDISAAEFMELMRDIQLPAGADISVTIKYKRKSKKTARPRSSNIDSLSKSSLKEYSQTNCEPLYSAATRCYGRLPSSENHMRRMSLVLKAVKDPSPYAQPIQIDHLNSQFIDPTSVKSLSMCSKHSTFGRDKSLRTKIKTKSSPKQSRKKENTFSKSEKFVSTACKSGMNRDLTGSVSYSVRSQKSSVQSQNGRSNKSYSSGKSSAKSCGTSVVSQDEIGSPSCISEIYDHGELGYHNRRAKSMSRGSSSYQKWNQNDTKECARTEDDFVIIYSRKNQNPMKRRNKGTPKLAKVVSRDDSLVSIKSDSDISQADSETTKVDGDVEYVKCNSWPACKKRAHLYNTPPSKYKASRHKSTALRQLTHEYKSCRNEGYGKGECRMIPKHAFDKSQIVFRVLHMIRQMNRTSYKAVCNQMCEAAADEYYRMNRYYRALRNMIIWCLNYSQWVGNHGTAWNFRLCYITYFPFCGYQIFPTIGYSNARRSKCAHRLRSLCFSKHIKSRVS